MGGLRGKQFAKLKVKQSDQSVRVAGGQQRKKEQFSDTRVTWTARRELWPEGDRTRSNQNQHKWRGYELTVFSGNFIKDTLMLLAICYLLLVTVANWCYSWMLDVAEVASKWLLAPGSWLRQRCSWRGTFLLCSWWAAVRVDVDVERDAERRSRPLLSLLRCDRHNWGQHTYTLDARPALVSSLELTHAFTRCQLWFAASVLRTDLKWVWEPCHGHGSLYGGPGSNREPRVAVDVDFES